MLTMLAAGVRHFHNSEAAVAMALELVASGDNQAVRIRDHVLLLLRARGSLEMQRDMVRVIGLQLGGWRFRHWTPFNELTTGEASSPAYRHAIERQRTQKTLSYGLDIWHGELVLRVLWADVESLDVVTFLRGPWEGEVLALT